MIGIFDSGVGGMTVARAIEQHCPGHSFIYFGDIARTPYGPKSPERIREYSVRNTEFLIAKGASLIVIACNSASSVAADYLRSRFDLPIIDVISPAVKKAVECADAGNIGVIGTRATVKSGVYEERIKLHAPSAKVFSRACPLLVPLVEEGWITRRETKMILRRYLHPLRSRQVRSLVLGCTHYPLLKAQIQPRIGKQTVLIDSSIETARYLCHYLSVHQEVDRDLSNKRPTTHFYVSDTTDTAGQLATKIFKRPITLEKVHV
jgi:glutamate racemase